MENTENIQDNGTVTTDSQEARTFTQEEVNQIVADRLKRESAKYTDYKELKEKASRFDEIEEANKSELQKATEKADALQQELDSIKQTNAVREIREKVATSTGVPANLLTAETEEECKAQAESILAFAKPGTYPTVKDGGEVTKVHTKSTSDEFADWFKKSLN